MAAQKNGQIAKQMNHQKHANLSMYAKPKAFSWAYMLWQEQCRQRI